MLRLYYKIWADAIISTREKRAEAGNWKGFTIVPLSLVMGLNLFTFFIWMKKLVNHYLPLVFKVSIFNARLLNDFVSVVLTLFIPFVILNYLLIFANNQYETITSKFGSHGGKLYQKYVLLSLGLFAVPLIIEKLFF